MFPGAYFPSSYFPDAYFPKTGGGVPSPAVVKGHRGAGMIIQALPYEWGEEYKRKKKEEEELVLLLAMLDED